MENKHQRGDLKQMQSLPLIAKIEMSKRRIEEWYNYWEGNVYVSFSGGKDSTVLLHLVRSMYPDVEAVFCDTGLEYPEIKEFIKSFNNITIIRPKKNFRQVLDDYGYPIISKEVAQCVREARKGLINGKYKYRLDRLNGCFKDKDNNISQYNLSKWKFLLNADFKISEQCCSIMKKNPIKKFEKQSNKKPILGTLAMESRTRTGKWVRQGCNAFEAKRPVSNPLSFWTENDILQYLYENKVPYCSIYGEIIPDGEIDGQVCMYITPKFKLTGLQRTGCMFCMFGAHLEQEPNRFQRMKVTHPEIYNYCLKPKEEGGLGMKEILDFINIKY